MMELKLRHRDLKHLDKYEKEIYSQVVQWQSEMVKNPSLLNKLSKNAQNRINKLIPEKIHQAITTTLKQMIRAVLFGASYTTPEPIKEKSLEYRESVVSGRIEFYRTTAAVEGGLTGAGGILLGFADFPILIGIKIKLLFEIAAIYGFNIKDYKERIFLLHIFELAYSSDVHRKSVYFKMTDWDNRSKQLPEDIHQFDWRNFQQEYRDYIDLAKLAQMVPWIGAPVGFVVNSRLIRKLGKTAMNAYRMRLLEQSLRKVAEHRNA